MIDILNKMVAILKFMLMNATSHTRVGICLPHTVVGERSSVIGNASHDIYKKNAEMDWTVSPGPKIEKIDRFRKDLVEISPYTSRHRASSLEDVPSYMSPTKSAKAKVRVRGPV